MPRTDLVIVDPEVRPAVEDRHNMVQPSKSSRVNCKQAHLEKQITLSGARSLRRTVIGGLHKWRISSITTDRMCYIPKDVGSSWA